MATFDLSLDTKQFLKELLESHKLDRIDRKLDRVLDRLEEQEKNMADLSNEFAAFAAEQTRLMAEINTQIEQLAAAFEVGNASAAVVEDARVKIVDATTAAKDAADRLAADNPVG